MELTSSKRYHFHTAIARNSQFCELQEWNRFFFSISSLSFKRHSNIYAPHDDLFPIVYRTRTFTSACRDITRLKYSSSSSSVWFCVSVGAGAGIHIRVTYTTYVGIIITRSRGAANERTRDIKSLAAVTVPPAAWRKRGRKQGRATTGVRPTLPASVRALLYFSSYVLGYLPQ